MSGSAVAPFMINTDFLNFVQMLFHVQSLHRHNYDIKTLVT